ncbi:isochorismatase family protein [Desulfobulbus alkaliphilus]|uniref:isochorismatase family protein n=1 Tax=Desulfobulbus alkaliphilus TaxID=869814 RepID=UPI0019632655|nr:isochorismatase family protein [Desulfobulbus alkaliphilus]MBM9537602.1 isochorismatase family protein [Desulfobulbus alkaliphilus]
MLRSEYVAVREESALLIIDIQQAMLKVIAGWEQVANRVRQLIQAADTLTVPILLTEQYRKGLGETLPQLLGEIVAPRVMHKEHFSACLEPDFLPAIASLNRARIVVVGMETHVCVLQTCLDLLKSGYQVHLVTDAVASRTEANRQVAIDMLRQAGAVITSTEIVIFQWACRANTDEFRRILPIVK